MTSIAMNISLQIFLLDVVQMEASYVSMILFVSRAWDAVTDPLVGYLVGRSNWTPIGKLTPWMVLSTPLGVFSYLLLWFVPQGSTSQAVNVLWFLAVVCMFETLMSCYHVPYLSLNMFLGGDHRDRDSATAYRMSVEMVAMLLASVIQGQVVAAYNAEKEEACQHHADHQTPPSTSSPPNASLQETQKAFLTSALVLGALFFLCSLVLFLGVTEQRGPLCSDDKVRLSYLTSLKLMARHIPYQRLVLGFVFSLLAFQMSLGNFALFCSHAAGLGAQFQHLLLVLLASASLAVPLWQTVLLKVGKKVTVFIGLSLFMPAVILVACVPTNLHLFMIMCVLMGFSVATVFLLPWSMLPDVVDDFAVRHPSCKDLEPLFFSCYAFCSKLSGGLSVGISTMTLQFVGYRASACNHGVGVVTALTVLFSPVPIALLLIAMVFFRSYPIDERRSLQLQEHQPTVHPAAPSSSSNQGENSERSTVLQARHASSRLKCPNTRPRPLNRSTSLAGFGAHDKKHSVSSFVLSDESKTENSTLMSVQPNTNLKQPERKIVQKRHSEDKSRNDVFAKNKPEPFSQRSYMKSKVSWV
ncbi:sodium-dependent lysophosphatidylcholine symporter 1-like [Antennarius striatus]|uniref:sodium-dependent lysophosphatidylcholine symporter 1-like n=1 Tax=Antennarius striatus TaxID=241820 RepID=UPI0035B3959A